jgi:hypothetical protein
MEDHMKSGTHLRTLIRIAATSASIAVLSLAATQGARADDPGKILKGMSDYLAGQKSLSAKFDSDIEAVTPELQKIQFTSSGEMKMNRPDKLRIRRTGGYADVELVFDGKTVSVLGKNMNTYVQADAPGTVDQLVDLLRNEYSIDMPGADLFLSNSYDEMMDGVLDAKHIGEGVVEGVECEHLAFRTLDTDWQIWVETGDHPIPRKYVITSKSTAAAPQYTITIRDWKTDAQASADAFTFKPPADAKKGDFASLSDIDEVPPGIVKGEMK